MGVPLLALAARPCESGTFAPFICAASALLSPSARTGVAHTSAAAANRNVFIATSFAKSSGDLRLFQRGGEGARQILGGTHAPIVQEHHSRAPAGHVLVDGDDVDPAVAQRLEYVLQLALQHREVAVDEGGGRRPPPTNTRRASVSPPPPPA